MKSATVCYKACSLRVDPRVHQHRFNLVVFVFWGGRGSKVLSDELVKAGETLMTSSRKHADTFGLALGGTYVAAAVKHQTF